MTSCNIFCLCYYPRPRTSQSVLGNDDVVNTTALHTGHHAILYTEPCIQLCMYLCTDSWLGTFHCYQCIPRGSRSPTFEVVGTPVDIFEQPLPRHPHWSPCSGDKSLCRTRDGEWCICSVGIHVKYQAKSILNLDGAGPHARGRRLIACGPVLSLWIHCQSNYSGVKLEDALTHMYCFI